MKKNDLYLSLALFTLFVLWTVALCFIDVKAIGPEGSSVGMASLNGWFRKLTGINITLYLVTDWLGLVSIGIAFSFGVMGFTQLIKRKSLLKVDGNILILGIFYVLVIIVFIFFEELSINYRPVLIEGVLESSYPSTTTLLLICINETAVLQFKHRLKNTALKKSILIITRLFTAFMVIGRAFSGVHWISDIIGAILVSTALVLLYRYFVSIKNKEGS